MGRSRRRPRQPAYGVDIYGHFVTHPQNESARIFHAPLLVGQDEVNLCRNLILVDLHRHGKGYRVLLTVQAQNPL